MKKNYSFLTLAAATATFIASLLCLCSCSSMEEEGTGYPLRLQASVEANTDLPENALSKDSPCHVVAFTREKVCTPFYFLFEEDAYVSSDGQLNWMGKYHYWPGTYCKFVAYWPAEANVVLDDAGNIVSADCALIAVSEPLCHFSENPTLIFLPFGEEGASGKSIG